MKIRTCLLVAALAAMGCGGGSGTNDGGPPAECISCIAQNCNTQATKVFGSGYRNNNFTGGVCPTFMSCKNDSQSVCAQQDGPSCETAFNALVACLDQTTCFNSACKNGGGGGGNTASGLTVSGNAMDFGTAPVGSSYSLCMNVTGANAQTLISQQITGCTSVGTCAFSNMPLYCSNTDSCDVCVLFAPQSTGSSSATLSIIPGLTVSLSGVGTGSTITSSPNTGSGGAAGKQCPPAGCITCYQQFCNNEAVAAFGPNYVNSNFSGGGLCPNLKNCACADGDPAVCAQQAGASCVAAFGTLSNCATVNCYGTCNSGESNGGSGGTGGITGVGGKVGTGGATTISTVDAGTGTGGVIGTGGKTTGTGGIISTGGQTAAGTVTFVNGEARGAMNGWGWVSLGSTDVVTDPLCNGALITSAVACGSIKPSWNSPNALCTSGTIPALPPSPVTSDYDANWGIQIGVEASNPSGPIGVAYSTIAVAVTGTPVTGLRIQLHRRGDSASTSYCASYTTATIPLTDFNTACWDGSGIQFTAADAPLLDKVMLFVPSTQRAITVTNLCITGITFGGNTGPDAGIGTGGITGTGGSTVVSNTGGSIGSGGIVGSGGTSTSSSGLACPLGTWTIDYGYPYPDCGTANFLAVSTVTQTLSGQYVVSSMIGPLVTSEAIGVTGTDSIVFCGSVSRITQSASYVNGVFTFTIPFDPGCNKQSTMAMKFDPSCTRADVGIVINNNQSCDANGTCRGCCGTMDCTRPNATALRSLQ